MFNIHFLKRARLQLGLTQHAFAKEAGVSQSMIAKIEANKLDPTYSYVEKIEHALNRLTKPQEKKAKEIMHVGLISVSKNDSLSYAVGLMKKYSISQLPVLEGNSVVGLVTETALIEQSIELTSQNISSITEEPPPIISEKATLSTIIALLKIYPLVLVTVEGNVSGTITKSDVIAHSF